MPQSPSWYTIRAAAQGAPAELTIDGEIGYFGVTAKHFAQDLKALGDVEAIQLSLNSPGGSVFEGMAIYNVLRAHPATITCTITGLAASIASIIMLAADTIVMPQNAYLMLHNPTAGAWGEEKDLRKAVKLLVKIKQSMVALYRAATGADEDTVRTWMDEETWFLGDEALAAGLVTEVTGKTALAACFDLERFDYQHVPETLAVLAAGAQDAVCNPSAVAGTTSSKEKNMPKKTGNQPGAAADATNPAAQPTPDPAPSNPPAAQPTPDPAPSNPPAAQPTPDPAPSNPPAAQPTPDPAPPNAPAAQPNPDPAPPNPPAGSVSEAVAAAVAGESERQRGIREAFAGFDAHRDLMDACLTDFTVTPEAASRQLLAALGANDGPTAGTVGVRDGDGQRRFLEHAGTMLAARAGLIDAPTQDNELIGYTLIELARAMLERRGIATGSLAKLDLVAAAFTHTSSDFSHLLSTTAKKAMLKGYEEAEETFTRFTASGHLPDFKVQSRVDIGHFPSLREVPEGAEYKAITLGDRAESAQLATFGELFSITRQAIINDDLGAFTRIPRKMGRAAIRTVGDLVWALLSGAVTMNDGKALFHADHGNLAGAAGINTGSVDAARVLLASQTEGAARLNIRPRFLLCPVALEGAAIQTMQSEFEVGAATKHNTVPNTVRHLSEVIADARLDSQDWFLLADPAMYDAIEVLYLDGQQAPVLEQKMGWNIDGTEFKVRIDAAAKVWDYRALVKTPGP